MQLPSPARLLGIDLGITSDHTAVVVDDAGRVRARRRARSTVASLTALEAAALAATEAGTHLVVVVEPTGPAWLPVAVFFGRRGHTVLRVTSAKAGPRPLRSQLVQSADTARKLDPQLAAVYHAQMTQRGATHRKALGVVAARLAERAWLAFARGEPYVVCDLHGRPVTPAQAKRLIAERFTVPAEVRRRRPSTKAGKAPHTALKAQVRSQREAGHEATFPTPA
jgi:hypothetical protein